MSNPCQALEQQLESLKQQKIGLSHDVGQDLADAGPSQKPAIIAQYKKEVAEIDAQIAKLRPKLTECQSKRDVVVAGSELDGLGAFDLAVQEFMHQNHVRAGQLTILKDGFGVLQHGYTYASSDFPRVKPGTLFRIASCSKAFTCAAIWQLYNEGKLHKNDPIYPLLGITKPLVGTVDPRSKTIMIDQLVNHAGGWNDHGSLASPAIPGTSWDPVFGIRKIANALTAPPNNLAAHKTPTKRQIAGYMYGQPLQFNPGQYNYSTSKTVSYSNYGYMLLGLAVEQVTRQPFVEYLKQSVLAPLGLDDHLFVSPMLSKQTNPLEVHYDDPGTGPTALDPTSNAVVPYAYGGEGYVTELMDSGGGLMTTATTLALFAHRRAAWGMGPRAVSPGRSGGMAGVSSHMESRDGDVDYAYIFNTRHFTQPGDPLGDFQTRLNALFAKTKIPTPELHLTPA